MASTSQSISVISRKLSVFSFYHVKVNDGYNKSEMRYMAMYRIAWIDDNIGLRAAVCLAVGFAALSLSCLNAASSDIPEAERRALELNKSVMCPVCPGESIDQSQNPLAAQMRAIVDDKLAEGWSEQEIKDFFVERYGPSVLLEPPSAGFGIAAWIVPPLAFALALASLLLTLRWMRRTAEDGDAGEVEDSERMEYIRKLEAATRNRSESGRERGESSG